MIESDIREVLAKGALLHPVPDSFITHEGESFGVLRIARLGNQYVCEINEAGHPHDGKLMLVVILQ